MFAGFGAWIASWFIGWTVWNWVKFIFWTVLIIGAVSFGVTYGSKVASLAKQNIALRIQVSDLQHEVSKYDGRLASYQRQIERRDNAIKQLPDKYERMVTRLIHHPDEIEDTTFTHPLDTHTEGQPNAVDTDPVPPFEWPDLSGVLPWNWKLW